MDVHTFGDVNNQLNVCIIVVVCATRNLRRESLAIALCVGFLASLLGVSAYLNILISHTNIIGVCLQIFRSGHDCELNGTLVTERLVGPFSHGTDFLDCGNTIVGNEDLDLERQCCSRAGESVIGVQLTEVMAE